MKQIKRIIVSAILISNDKKILFGRNRDGGVYPDCWHIPGGGVEKGEDNRAALDREVLEEVGIDISNIPAQLISDSDSGKAIKTDKNGEKYLVKMQFFVYQVDLPMNSSTIAIHLNDDLVDAEWISFDGLKNYKHTPPTIRLFKKLGWI